MSETDSFIPGGFEAFPSLKSDNERVGLLGSQILNKKGQLEYTYSTPRLEELVRQYGHYLNNDPMPRGKKTAERVMEHLLFELRYRSGGFNEIIKQDEICEEV